jgi:AcrR family transcriptional regulator
VTSGERIDPRVRRTRARLHEAVLSILQATPDEPISVAGIARRADVNRATVYQHYADLDALLTAALTAEVLAVVADLRGCPFQEPGTPPALLALFSRVAEHSAVYARMLAGGALADQLATALADDLTARFQRGERPPHDPHVPARLHAEFLAGGLVRLLGYAAERPEGHQGMGEHAWSLLRGASQ